MRRTHERCHGIESNAIALESGSENMQSSRQRIQYEESRTEPCLTGCDDKAMIG